MLRAVASAALAGSRTAALRPTSSAVSVAKRWSGHGSSESPEGTNIIQVALSSFSFFFARSSVLY